MQRDRDSKGLEVRLHLIAAEPCKQAGGTNWTLPPLAKFSSPPQTACLIFLQTFTPHYRTAQKEDSWKAAVTGCKVIIKPPPQVPFIHPSKLLPKSPPPSHWFGERPNSNLQASSCLDNGFGPSNSDRSTPLLQLAGFMMHTFCNLLRYWTPNVA